MRNKDTRIKTKRIDFLGMWKDFWGPETPEKSGEEEILSDQSISEADKKALLKALKDTDKLGNMLFRESYKVGTLQRKNLKEDAKLNIDQSKQRNPQIVNQPKNKEKDDSQREIVD